MLTQIKSDLKKFSKPEKAAFFPRFFKTGKGEYGEGDKFIGVTVPDQRIVVRKYYSQATLDDVRKLLQDPIHEYRLTALLMLVEKYKHAKKDEKLKQEIYNFYLSNTKFINNWDLVDTSAPYIVGAYLFDKDRSILVKLAKSKVLWEQRISILATQFFIRQNDFEYTLKIAEMLLHHKHDLIHKAVGWMLREVGNRDQQVEEGFLKKHYKTMPRTMLRYAIEKFKPELREKYLKGGV